MLCDNKIDMANTLKPTKYYTSILLRFQSVDRFLYRFADRDEAINPPKDLFDRVRSCLIYLICSRPIISIVPGTIEKVKDHFQFEIKHHKSGKEKTCKVTAPKGVVVDLDGRIEVSGFPHKEILSYDPDGNLVVQTLISNFVHLLTGLPEDISHHEVLYVGKGTSDCAVDRLNGHSTLERILADVLRSEPEKEIALMLYNFEMKKDAISITGIREKAEIRGESAKEHYSKIFEFKPSIDEQACIAEALLINYFNTRKYNSDFTKGLSRSQKTLSSIYEFDFDAVVIELDNENIGFLKIYSTEVKPNYYHHALLDIRKLEGRISLFDTQSVMNNS